MTQFEIDLDDIAAKRQEELGSADRFPFVYKSETWWCLDPLELDDDQKRELQATDPADLDAVLDFYLGVDQAEKFVEAGGTTSKLVQALNIWQQRNTDASGPTRPGRFSNRAQRRSKQH